MKESAATPAAAASVNVPAPFNAIVEAFNAVSPEEQRAVGKALGAMSAKGLSLGGRAQAFVDRTPLLGDVGFVLDTVNRYQAVKFLYQGVKALVTKTPPVVG